MRKYKARTYFSLFSIYVVDLTFNTAQTIFPIHSCARLSKVHIDSHFRDTRSDYDKSFLIYLLDENQIKRAYIYTGQLTVFKSHSLAPLKLFQ